MTSRYNTVDRFEFSKLVTPSESRKRPIYDWFVYPHSFSPSLVWSLIEDFSLNANHRIFDPFVGAGTTVLAAKQRGISAMGQDLLPISVALTKAKTARYDLSSLNFDLDAMKDVIFDTPTPHLSSQEPILTMSEDENSILSQAFDREALEQLVFLKNMITRFASSESNFLFFLTALAAILEPLSGVAKSGGWLKVVQKPAITRLEIVNRFIQTAQKMIGDLKNEESLNFVGDWGAKQGDARILDHDLGCFDAIISSPPYLNRHDYTRVLAIELLIGFINADSEIKQLRYDLLQSHIEARAKLVPVGYQMPSLLEQCIGRMAEKKAERRLLRIVTGYFEDMYAVLRCMNEYLLPGGHLVFVLGNVRFCGVSIPVDHIISELGEMAGLHWHQSQVARLRNNSAQQMRDYGRDPARETVIIWRKP